MVFSIRSRGFVSQVIVRCRVLRVDFRTRFECCMANWVNRRNRLHGLDLSWSGHAMFRVKELLSCQRGLIFVFKGLHWLNWNLLRLRHYYRLIRFCQLVRIFEVLRSLSLLLWHSLLLLQMLLRHGLQVHNRLCLCDIQIVSVVLYFELVACLAIVNFQSTTKCVLDLLCLEHAWFFAQSNKHLSG